MTLTQLLLCILAEEGGEVAQRALKAQRFGIHEKQADGPSDNKEGDARLSNAQRIQKEYADIVAVYELLQSHGLVEQPTRDQINAKKLKVHFYADYSRAIMALDGNAPPVLSNIHEDWVCGACTERIYQKAEDARCHNCGAHREY